MPWSATLAIYGSFTLLLALALAPGFGGRGTSSRWPPARAPLFAAFGFLPYLLYAAGTHDFRWMALAKLAAVPAICLGVYASMPIRRLTVLCPQDAAVAVFLIGVVLSGRLKGIWNVPVNLDFMGRLFLIAAAGWAWRYGRPLPGLGYDLRLTRPILKQAAINFGFFTVLALPLSLALHFTRFNPRWHGLLPFAASYLEIFLFIALLEELFFRGFLQTLLTGTLRSGLLAQAIVSLLFGLFHILHAPFPNWRYVALATLAGWFYGTAFRQTGNITSSALVHAAVDTVWRTWLSA